MWYVRELARLFRTRYGRDLAFHLELVMRKWQTLGLSPNIMQIIACEIHNSLKPAEAILPNIGNPSPKPKGKSPQRHKGTRTEAQDEGQSPKDKAGQKDEVRSPKDEANPQEGKSEVRNPNGEERTANSAEAAP